MRPAAQPAHRMHGAIGFTIEYALNHLARRLMAGAAHGGHGLWREMAARTDRLV